MTYRDRTEAGRLLAAELERLIDDEASVLVLGVARGGMPVAAEVAAAFGAELDVAVARKVGAPGNPEFAIGAVASDGDVVLNREAIRAFSIPDSYVKRASEEARAEVDRRVRAYRGGREAPRIAGRTVIVVDDGVATGSTLIAVLRSVRAAGASRLVCAVPVGPPDTVAALGAEADVVVCPLQPAAFRAVGLWYEDFSQLDDEDVISALGIA